MFDHLSVLNLQVFRALEYPAEVQKQEFHRERLLTERWNLIRFVSERSNGTDSDGVEKLLSDHLAVYERVSIVGYMLYYCKFTENRLSGRTISLMAVPTHLECFVLSGNISTVLFYFMSLHMSR